MLALRQDQKIVKVTVAVAEDVAAYLSNKKRRRLALLEDEGEMTIQVLSSADVAPEHVAIQCWDSEGREIKFPGD